MRLPLLLTLLGLVLVLAPACTETDATAPPAPPAPPPPATLITVRAADSDAPVAGVKVAVMARATNRLLAGPLLSDADGVCVFGDTLGEPWAALVYGGGSWRIFGATATGPAVTADTTRALVRVAPIPAPGGVHISGTVIDAETYEPLGGVFIGSNPYPSGYVGGTGPGDDATRADGAFRVSEIPFAQIPGTMNLFQAVPLFVTRAGYLPRGWRYEPRPGERLDEVVGVEILLQKDDGAPRGALRGRLLRDGEPAAGVVVGLGTAPLVPVKGGAGVPGRTALSDTAGVFLFDGLPAGRYILQPGFLPLDGAFYPNQPANTPRVVEPDSTLDAGDFVLVWEMDPLAPVSGSRVPTTTREYRWTAAPGAVTYRLTRDGADPLDVSEPSYTIPGDRPLRTGAHFWSVLALDADDQAVGTFGETAEFFVPAGEDP